MGGIEKNQSSENEREEKNKKTDSFQTISHLEISQPNTSLLEQLGK